MKIATSARCLLLPLFFLLFSLGAKSQNYYVNDIYIPGSDMYTTATGNDANPGTAAAPFATIQKAVSVASAGNTIFVDGGTYTLTAGVTVNKKLIIKGIQAGVDARTRSSVPESIVDAVNVTSFPVSAFAVQPAASESTIDGFTIQGSNGDQSTGGVYLQPGSFGTLVQNNIIQNNTAGIFLANNSASSQTVIRQNLFRNNTAAGSGSGNDIYADNSTASSNLQNVLITNNNFTNTSLVVDSWAVGIGNVGSPAFTNLTIQNNLVSNHGRGMYFYGASNSSVTGNTISGTSNYAIGLFDGAIPNSSFTISNNTLTNNFRGIYLAGGSTPAYTGTLAPAGNTFTGGTYYLVNESAVSTTTVINAVGNTYDGVLLNGSTTKAQIFAIADKVLDKVDVSTYGYIILKASNVYVTANSFYSPATTTPSVQRGIDAATTGDNVNVNSGTFTGQLEINKQLSLLGEGVGVTNINSPAVLALSYTLNGNPHKPIVYVHDAAGVIIKNITVNGLGNGNANNRFEGIAYRNAGGTIDNCEIKGIRNNPFDGVQGGVAIYAYADNGTGRTLNVSNNALTDFQKNGTVFGGANLSVTANNNTITGVGPTATIAQNGIQVSGGATGNVTDNTISNISYTPATVEAAGILVFGPGNVQTSGNTVNNVQAGIYYTVSGGSITNNVVTNTVAGMGATPYWYAISVDGGTYTVSQNEIDGGGNGAGVRTEAYVGDPATTMTATNNTVANTNTGFIIKEENGTVHANTTINNNSIGSSNKFIDNQGTTTSNATCNWYGTTDGAVIGSKISGPVIYTPFLTSGSDAQPGTRGFQPQPNSCNGNTAFYVDDNSNANDIYTPAGTGSDANPGTAAAPFATIAKAMSAAGSGDVIFVDAGTFVEQVNANKTITITGAASSGVSQTTIKAPATLTTVSPNGTSHKVVVYASGAGNTVNISKVVVDGDGRGGGGSAFEGVYYFEASGSFSNSRIIKVRDASFSGVQSGLAFLANHTYDASLAQTVTVNNNIITDYQKGGIVINELNTQGIVTNNIVTGQNIENVNGQNGIQFAFGAYGTITGNTVTNNTYNGANSDDAAGILIAGVGVNQNNVATGNTTTIGGAGALANTLNGNEVGLLTDAGGYGYDSNAGVVYGANTFANNLIHVYHNNPATVPSASFTYDKRVDNTSQTNIVYGQIQRAVNDATAGNVLNAGAGTFTEQVEIPKAITLNGQGVGVTNINSPAVLALSYTIGTNTNKPVVYVHDAAGVIIKNITVNGLGNGNANNRFQGIAYRNAGGTVQDCEIKAIRNNPIDGVQAGVAVYAYADNGTARTLNVTHNTLIDFQKNATVFAGANLTVNVDNNTITGAGSINFTAQNGVQISTGAAGSVTNNIISGFNYTLNNTATATGVLIFGASGSVLTSGNTLSNAQAGIYYVGNSGNITNNIVNYNAATMSPTPYWYGIDVNNGTFTVSGNEIDNDGNGAGIEADAYAGETTILTATNNKVVDADEGFVIYTDGSGIANSTINNNSITGSVSNAIHNYGTTTSNATCNWYGSNDLSVVAPQIEGPVIYMPYLNDGTDTQPATRGFQPAAGTCVSPTKLYVNDGFTAGDGYTSNTGSDASGNGSTTAPFASITKALSIATTGDTIYVDAGTYQEDVVVDKEVTIRGLSQALTIVYPATSNPVGSGGTLGGNNIFLVKANNVTIQDLTADGANPNIGVAIDARNGIVTSFDPGNYTNLVVHHTTVKNIYNRGIYSTSTSIPGTFNFHHNTVTNVQGDAASIGIYNYGNTGIIDNNTVTNTNDAIAANQSTGTIFSNNTTVGSGIHTDNNGGSGGGPDTLKNNTVSNVGSGGYGILVFLPSLNVIVEENTITNSYIAIGNVGQGASGVTPVFRRNTIDGQGLANSTGVFQTTSIPNPFVPSNVSGTYLNNFIKNNQQGFYLKHEAGRTSTITVNNNSITGNTTTVAIAVGPDGAGTLINDFKCNWYGGPAPVVTGGTLNYQPTLINGTDNEPTTPGFQPVPGSCNTCQTPDVVAPTIVLKPNPTVFLTAANTYTVQLSDVLQSVSDNCDPNPSASVSNLQVTCANLGSGSGGGTPHQAYVSDKTVGNANYAGQFGLTFKVNSASGIIIDKLGAFDDQSNGTGITGSEGGGVRVAIFNQNTQAMVTGLDVTIVGTADPLVGNYRVRTLATPVTLPAGNYVIVTKGYVGEKFYNRNQTGPLNPAGDNAGGALTFLNTVYYGTSASFSFPAGSGDAGNPNEYIAGTFNYSLGASNSVTVTATDATGNTSMATTSVTVIDTFYVLTTKNATVNLNSNGQATIVPADVLQSLKNNCGVDVTTSTFVVSPSTFTCADVASGTTPSPTPHQAYVSNQSIGNANYAGQFGLTFKVNDANGIIIDKLGAFDDQSNGTGITGSEGGGVRVAIFNQNTQAMVTGLDVTIVGTADPLVGNYRVRTLATPVTLPAGNYVIVTKGYVGEKFYNRNQTGPLNPAGDNAGGALTFLNTVYYGTSASFSFPAGSGDAGNPNEYIAGTFNYKTLLAGGVTVTLTSTDVYGHQDQATAQVAVKDVTGPTVITKNITLNLNASGTASIVPNDVLQSPVTDNCGVQSVTVSPNSFTCADYSPSGGSGIPHQAYVSNQSIGNFNYDGQFGLTFKVNSANGIVIDKLGAFDDQSNGTGITGSQSGGVRVAIFNQNTQALVPGLDVTIVGTTDPLVGNYRMRSLATPVTLPAGNYVIVTKGYVGEKFYNRQQTGPLNPAGDNAGGALTFLNTVYYGSSATFSFPAGSGDAGNPNEYIAGTFNYALNVSNNKIVTVTATDVNGNVTTATATVTLTNTSGSCTAPPVMTYAAKSQQPMPLVVDNVSMSIKVYPNPSSGQFTVQLLNLKVPKVALQIMDANGQVVVQKEATLTGKTPSLSIPVDISKHASGMYLIKIISADGIQTTKVVVSH